jgi:phosphoenolpyruvate phosphomutase / 2-hydroxyethylphosphonate cytidylyltransferase
VKKNKKIVYVGLSADILHEGHINILNKAKSFGYVIVGLLTDEAITSYKKLPHLTFAQREIVLKNIKTVDKVVHQKTLDYRPNLLKFKPSYVVHGDDWREGIQKETRKQVIETLKKWSGKLIEVPYTKNISSSKIKEKFIKTGTTPDIRKSKFKRLINVKKIVRILEAHSPLSAMIVENTNIVKNKKFYEFDGMWSSSLTDSALRGKPDNESVDTSSRLNTLNEILSVTTKPIIFDADTGGRNEHLPYTVKALENAGISAIIIEDKIGLKKNSLFKNQKNATQDSIKNFCKKIQVAVNSKISDEFMIIARIESFILGKNLKDALKRAEAYSKAGADAILIHSKERNPKQIIQFSKKFIKSKYKKPIVAVPSTYSSTYEKTLQKSGVSIIIYANHLLRASYPSMMNVAKSILKHERSKEAEKNIIPIKKIISLIK